MLVWTENIWRTSKCWFAFLICVGLSAKQKFRLLYDFVFCFLVVFTEYYLKRNKFVALIFVAVWGHTIFFTSLPLFGWSRYTQEAFGTSCTIDWIDTSPPILAYNIIIVITCYCMHVVIFIFCYYYVIKEFTVASQCIVRMRDEVIVDAETQKLEVILKCHKTMTYRKVTMVRIMLSLRKLINEIIVNVEEIKYKTMLNNSTSWHILSIVSKKKQKTLNARKSLKCKYLPQYAA